MTFPARLRTLSERQPQPFGMVLIGISVAAGIVVVIGLSLLGSIPASSSTADATQGLGPPQAALGLIDTGDNHGQVAFGRSCDSCHPGGYAGQGSSLRLAQFKRQYTSDDKIISYVRKGGFDMPAFGTDRISDGDVQAIAAYVLSLPQADR